MSKKRFIILPNNVIWDNQLDVVVCRCILEGIGDAENVCQRLNEQQATIQSLQKDIMEMSDNHQSYIEMESETKSKVNDIVRTQRREIRKLSKENEQLRKIGIMYQGHNPCSNCTYCVEDKVCCGIYPPIFCDEMKKDYFVHGLCKKHKQIQKSIRKYGD